MGVKLQDIIQRKKVEFSQLEGKIITIDAPNIIMSLFTFSYKNQVYSYEKMMTDRTQRAISHLYGILFRINFYYSKKIFPIFCFDGRVSDLKRIITKDQLNDFRFTSKWYRNALESGDINLAKHYATSKEFLWPNILLESKILLSALGVPWIDSPASAESQCAHLVKEGIAHYSNSQDFDSLLFGCPKVIQNLSKSLRRKVQNKWTYQKIIPLSINLEQNLKRLNLDLFQLVDLAILIGTDYFSGIKSIGPKTALKLIKAHRNIENIISTQKEKYDFTDLNSELISNIRKIFLLPEVSNSFENVRWDPPNRPKILELMCEDHHLNKERVENNVDKVFNNYYKCLKFFNSEQSHSSLIQKTLDTIL